MQRILAGLMLLATPSFAQDANQITLKYDDGSGVSGELVEFVDGTFRIQASVGLVAIPAKDVSCIGAACPDGTALEVAPAPITLTSVDGQTSISGDLLAFEEGEYVIATDVGEMRINADQVTCEGTGCVESEAPVEKTVVLANGSTTIEGELLGFEDGTYIIEVEQFGELRVDAGAFDCRGDACP